MNQFEIMLRMQDEFNKKVHPEWRSQNFAFHEAIIVEGAELLEHLGYKWWKKNDINLDQAIMELIDIWHFGISHTMLQNPNLSYEEIDDQCYPPHDVMEYVTIYTPIEQNLPYIKSLVIDLINGISDSYTPVSPHGYGFFSISTFIELWCCFGLSLDDLYKRYIGKNALNEFRQLNGYKEGTYIKIWNGKEDNEHLTNILNDLEDDETLYQDVLTALSKIYSSL